MPFPPDSRVLELLSVFDDTAGVVSDRYCPAAVCQARQYIHHARTGDLGVTLWNHSGTAWVSLQGLLSRRAARALATVLVRTAAAEVVLDVAALTLPTASGGTPLVTLCATLSHAGYSVALVGREDEVVFAEAESDYQPDRLVVLQGHGVVGA